MPESVVYARQRPLGGAWSGVVIAATVLGLILAINQIFDLRFLVGLRLAENSYLYLFVGLFCGLTYLLYPAKKSAEATPRWYDVALCLATLAICAYFAASGRQINRESWEFGRPPAQAVILALVFWTLVMEGARRVCGLGFTLLILVFALYPVYAGVLPGPIKGFNLSFTDTVRFHVFSTQSIFGSPTQVTGTLLVGFLAFGVVFQISGAGRFFADLALALLGHVRGGTAKVAILASGLFGMMSGSGVSNVYTTGTATIPAMIRSGFRPDVAAAVEANAGNGGALMPPVMGATAYLMASVLSVPYADVALAAAIPAVLFYLSLFIQLDAYAARHGIQGISRHEAPSLRRTLQNGWMYLVTFGVLIGLLVSLRQEERAPWLATALLALLMLARRETRWTWARLRETLESTGRLLVELVALLAAVGMLIGSLYVSGTAATLTSDLIHLSGGGLVVLLLLGALVSFVLGTGLPVTAAYIFLAIMLAPALVKQGLDPMAVHLFILYWATLSDVTPPVAIAVVAAAGIAGSPLMRTMMEATRLAAVKYALPFFFILSPALVLRSGDAVDFVVTISATVLGVAAIAYALQGYLPWLGVVRETAAGYLARAGLIGGGLCLAVPTAPIRLAGLMVILGVYLVMIASRRSRSPLSQYGRAL